MSEKQASSEIAQSRERFEKFAQGRYRGIEKHEDGSYRWNDVQFAWECYEQSERDTRERMAQLAKLVLIQVTGPDGFLVNPGKLEKLLAERIRGKE